MLNEHLATSARCCMPNNMPYNQLTISAASIANPCRSMQHCTWNHAPGQQTGACQHVHQAHLTSCSTGDSSPFAKAASTSRNHSALSCASSPALSSSPVLCLIRNHCRNCWSSLLRRLMVEGALALSEGLMLPLQLEAHLNE
jgi:hypothetical protein